MSDFSGIARTFGLFAISSILLTGAFANAADDKPKHTIKEIMTDAHKGDTAIIRKATTGKATPDELKTLAAYYKEMAMLQAPKGDAASWKEKTLALSKASDALAKGDASAAAQLRTASNCKACHTLHRPE